MKSIIEQAYNFANKHHQGQKRLDGENYINHPYRVALAVADDNDPIISCIALLHDLIEDTNVSALDIAKEFGNEIAMAVLVLSKTDEGQSYMDFIDDIKTSYNPRAIKVKIADIKDNLKTIDNIPDPEKRERLRKRYVKALEVLES